MSGVLIFVFFVGEIGGEDVVVMLKVRRRED
jgi:hypothetical protein